MLANPQRAPVDADVRVASPSVTTSVGGPGFRPPQQARSRAALQRLLAAAEDVLATNGLEEFTIAAVADRAGMSVGGVYRRFTGKEQLIAAVIDQLLTSLQRTVADSLAAAPDDLPGVVSAFADAFAAFLERSGPILATAVGGPVAPDSRDKGLAVMTSLDRMFLDAALPHAGDINHPAPSTALTMSMRTIMSAAVHRAAAAPWWPDGLTWTQWAAEIASMTTGYLTRPPADRGTRRR
jgi:AcrR family transcriptional regulator